MNKENAAKWVAALRSGEYTQAEGRLRAGDSFCCLGVLCDLYARENPDCKWMQDGSFDVPDDCTLAPTSVPVVGDQVAAWIGEYEPNSYAKMNDNGKTFLEIAAQIEKDAGLLNDSATPVPHSTGGIL